MRTRWFAVDEVEDGTGRRFVLLEAPERGVLKDGEFKNYPVYSHAEMLADPDLANVLRAWGAGDDSRHDDWLAIVEAEGVLPFELPVVGD